MLALNTVHQGDCLELLKDVEDGSIDAIITDPPYGTTACKWDSIIPFEPMWEQLNRVIKQNGAIVLFGSQPFTSALIMSNVKNYKHSWVWNKKLAGNAIAAKKQPLKIHEDIIIFSNGKCPYIPQMTKGKFRKKNGIKNKLGTLGDAKVIENDDYYPISIQEFSNAGLRKDKVHLTQKPVALMEYLIKTYTNENETVLDFTAGSGTTGVAAQNTNRNFILIEKEEKYVEICKKRLQQETLF